MLICERKKVSTCNGLGALELSKFDAFRSTMGFYLHTRPFKIGSKGIYFEESEEAERILREFHSKMRREKGAFAKSVQSAAGQMKARYFRKHKQTEGFFSLFFALALLIRRVFGIQRLETKHLPLGSCGLMKILT
jgi:hypothetical protein